MTPRPYQIEACNRIRAGWSDFDKQLLVLPTGSGKTIIAANISAEWVAQNKRVLFLAHREELLTQTLDKFQRASGIFAQLEKAEHRASLESPVVVGSVQTFCRRFTRWPREHFDLIIVDEAHHTVADSYMGTLNYFGKAKVIGVTATPDRGDRKNLGQFFENVAMEVPLFDLINQGYLSRIHVKAIPIKLDLGSVKSTAGDYDANDLGDALAPYLHEIAKGIQREAAGRRTLAFLPLRATSNAFVAQCHEVGIDARHIDGESPDRREILESFSKDEFQLLSNAMLLTEGFDDPGIDCIVVLRPTRSRPLFTQMVGRGTRIAPMKENLLLLDFLWLSQRHNLVRPAHLVAPTEEIAELMTAKMTEAAGDGDELDLEGLSGSAQHERENKLREELERQSKKKAFSADAMEFCLSVGNLAAAEWEDTMPWHSRPPSEKQLALIQGAGIAPESIRSRGHASAVIDLIQSRRALNLATPKQVKLLSKLGHAAPEAATKEQAGAFISLRIRKYSRGVAA